MLVLMSVLILVVVVFVLMSALILVVVMLVLMSVLILVVVVFVRMSVIVVVGIKCTTFAHRNRCNPVSVDQLNHPGVATERFHRLFEERLEIMPNPENHIC